MSSHATTFGPPPTTTAKFSTGKIIKIAAHEMTLETKTRRRPKRLAKCGKRENWKIPFIPPNKDIQKPMEAGLKSSPPYWTGVDHTSGMHDSSTAPRNASIE